jgi:hypothetical protein
LCIFPVFVSLFRRRETTTQVVVFFKPAEQFGKFSPHDSDDDKTKLKMRTTGGSFVIVKEVRFVEYVDHDVVITLEYVGKLSENSRYQFELLALDEHDEILVSSWDETQDLRWVTQRQNESEYAKKYNTRFIPLYVLTLGTGVSEEIFNRIVKIKLVITAMIGQ